MLWLVFDGRELTVYSQPTAAKIAHIATRPRVGLNLDSDSSDGGVIAVGGAATVDETDVDPRDDAAHWAKYSDNATQFGLTDVLADFSTRLMISVDRR